MARREPNSRRHETAVPRSSVQPDPALLAAYVERFNDGEVAAGYLPSQTLARLCAHLDLCELINTRKRMARRARGNPFAFEERRETRVDHGTLETRRKKRRDQVAALLARGQITRMQTVAAGEVRDAYAAVLRSLMPARRADIRVDQGRRQITPIDRWSQREERIIRTRYGPWKLAMRQPVTVELPGDRRVTVRNVLEVTMDLVWDNAGPRQIDNRYRLRAGVARRLVAISLERYCVLAGWGEAPFVR